MVRLVAQNAPAPREERLRSGWHRSSSTRGLAGLHHVWPDHDPQQELLQMHQLRLDERLHLTSRDGAPGLKFLARPLDV